MLLSLDFAKAYSQKQWPFPFQTLQKMRFEPVFSKFISSWHQKRISASSINGHVKKPFRIYRGVQQGNPISSFLFVNQMIPLYKMIKKGRSRCGISLTATCTLPTGLLTADDSFLFAKSLEDAVQLKTISENYCRGSGATLHPEKCVAILVKPHHSSMIPSGIKVLTTGQATTLLGVPTGCDILRKEVVGSVLYRMMEHYKMWENRARTTQSYAAVATSITLSALRYVLSVLPTNTKELHQIPCVIYQFMYNYKVFQQVEARKRSSHRSTWYFNSTQKRVGDLHRHSKRLETADWVSCAHSSPRLTKTNKKDG